MLKCSVCRSSGCLPCIAYYVMLWNDSSSLLILFDRTDPNVIDI